MLVRPKQSQGRHSTRVGLENEELSFIGEFRYLGHVMTADCRDDKDIQKQFRRQNAVGPRYTSLIHQLESGICNERNRPYQFGVPQICLQLDERSNRFLQQYGYCHYK